MWVSGGEELRRKGEWQLGYRCSPGGKERENAGRENRAGTRSLYGK